MPRYTIESPVQHDGTDYEIGADIELSAKAAKQLLEAGAIREVVATADKKKKPTAENDGDK